MVFVVINHDALIVKDLYQTNLIVELHYTHRLMQHMHLLMKLFMVDLLNGKKEMTMKLPLHTVLKRMAGKMNWL
jgi:hypothetical protein